MRNKLLLAALVGVSFTTVETARADEAGGAVSSSAASATTGRRKNGLPNDKAVRHRRLLVSGRNDPCVSAAAELSRTYGPAVGRHFVKQAFGRRGILGTVLATGVVRTGDEVMVRTPAPASR